VKCPSAIGVHPVLSGMRTCRLRGGENKAQGFQGLRTLRSTTLPGIDQSRKNAAAGPVTANNPESRSSPVLFWSTGR
jgi:hypothetical protein